MTRLSKLSIGVFCLLTIAAAGRANALEILHFIEGGDYQRVMEKATGLKIADDGVVYITSSEKGTLLRIVDGRIEANSLSPSVFRDNDLGGVDMLPDGRLLVVNQDSGQVAILNAGLQAENLFSQSGSDAGELDDPGPLAASINNIVFVGDVKNRQVSVFNQQGLFLHTIGREGSADDIKGLTHISIDAEENVYVLEGPGRISIYNSIGELIARFSARDLQQYFGETPEFSAMTTDLDGNLYLGDYVQSRITILDWRNLKVLGQIGSLGQSRAQFRDISLLSVNAGGQLAVVDRKNRKLEVYQLD